MFLLGKNNDFSFRYMFRWESFHVFLEGVCYELQRGETLLEGIEGGDEPQGSPLTGGTFPALLSEFKFR